MDKIFMIHSFEDFMLAIMHPIKYIKWLISWRNIPKNGVNYSLKSWIEVNC